MGSNNKAEEYFTSMQELEDLEFLGMPLIVCVADLSKNEYPPNGEASKRYDLISRVEDIKNDNYSNVSPKKLEKKLHKLARKDYKRLESHLKKVKSFIPEEHHYTITSNFKNLQSLVNTSIEKIAYNKKEESIIQFEDELESEPKHLQNDYSGTPPMAPKFGHKRSL